MIVNPWGEITAQLAAGIGAVACPLNRDMQHAIQQKMPMIEQERFTLAQLT